MGITYKGISQRTYTTGPEVNRGGEGIVFEVEGQAHLVLKVYFEKISSEKVEKLKFMVSMNSENLQRIAAWPKDVVFDSRNLVCGFVMKRLDRYVPMHKLFSPMDRKVLFPDKGYNFIVHVCKNLVLAFCQLHESKIIAGDVNEGNLLVNENGLVAFIDCDSFQIVQNGKYHFCEVGVPRYTPPELLNLSSFDRVIRTTNTDIFSMAILIFQLLFLGRHPFAGKPASNEELDEENAIRKMQFAYSLENHSKKLLPPPNSFDFKSLSVGLSKLFHRAFEQIVNRPPAIEWVDELSRFGQSLIICGQSKIHSYPNKLSSCPWCAFSKNAGIVFFLDDVYVSTGNLEGLEKFVNGFRIPDLKIKSLIPDDKFKTEAPIVDEKYIRYGKFQKQIPIPLVVISILCAFYSVWSIVVGVLIFVVLEYVAPLSRRIHKENNRLREEFITISNEIERLTVLYNNFGERNSFLTMVQKYNEHLTTLKTLPDKFNNAKKDLEQKLYSASINEYMSRTFIKNVKISGFGNAKVEMLSDSGIHTAQDINKLQRIKVIGIGPKNIQILQAWQRQVASTYVYRPDTHKLKAEMAMVNQRINAEKVQLESHIRSQFQSLNTRKKIIEEECNRLADKINLLKPSFLQAEAEYKIFKNLLILT
ncbi:MAG TPA: hypothetical protein VGQ53_19010 [Chitinophagaceae bacterium]|jgi:DNA-binding helix-hairpin-helix protein with protein kinase domain|nr:hypothetical protein [Chitinophagaceae bacterium]